MQSLCDWPVCAACALLVPPGLGERAKAWGTVVSGALFGAGWWFWVDAVACTQHKIPFDQFLPGIVATLALVMMNCLRRTTTPLMTGGFCRSRFWLFLSYVVSFAAVIGAVWVLMQHAAVTQEARDVWPGAAGVLQVACILGSGLLFFVSRSPVDGTTGGYEVF